MSRIGILLALLGGLLALPGCSRGMSPEEFAVAEAQHPMAAILGPEVLAAADGRKNAWEHLRSMQRAVAAARRADPAGAKWDTQVALYAAVEEVLTCFSVQAHASRCNLLDIEDFSAGLRLHMTLPEVVDDDAEARSRRRAAYAVLVRARAAADPARYAKTDRPPAPKAAPLPRLVADEPSADLPDLPRDLADVADEVRPVAWYGGRLALPRSWLVERSVDRVIASDPTKQFGVDFSLRVALPLTATAPADDEVGPTAPCVPLTGGLAVWEFRGSHPLYERLGGPAYRRTLLLFTHLGGNHHVLVFRATSTASEAHAARRWARFQPLAEAIMRSCVLE